MAAAACSEMGICFLLCLRVQLDRAGVKVVCVLLILTFDCSLSAGVGQEAAGGMQGMMCWVKREEIYRSTDPEMQLRVEMGPSRDT